MFWKRFLLWFDRGISTHKAFRSLLMVVILCVGWTVFFWLIGLAWGVSPYVHGCHEGGSRIDEVVSLVIGQSNYPISSAMPHWYQLVVTMVGAVFFTAFLISAFGNILTNRAASHRKGYLHYYFSNHVLILGGSKVVVGLLKSIAADEQLRKKTVVILSNQDAEGLWEYIVPLLADEKQKKKLMIYHGERNMKKALRFCQAELASVIYIIGEDEEKEHDSINVDGWKQVKALREEKSETMAQCYMLLERNASTYVFNALPGEDTKTMETTIVNRLESVAQQVLIGDDERWKDYTLDRGKMDKDSDKCVHFVVVGMTQMGYAMATTAAHLCHYPNFDEKGIRTKITFIDPNAQEEMKMFWGRYPGLFELSHSSFRGCRNNKRNRSNLNSRSAWSKSPKEGFGDFLDVEWEFVKGSVVDDWVRDLLDQWRQEEKQKILTLAFCGENAERNMAQALYLPREFFRHVDEEKPLTESDPLIWVYQPENSTMVETAHEKVGRYKNLLPFGTMTDSFDSRMGKRLADAKRINYLYKKEYDKEPYGTMAGQEELDRLWHDLSYAEKMSNIYAANSVYTKFRSMGINEGEKVKEDDVEPLAKIEHARWNMEKLLVGFRALTGNERKRINDGLKKKDINVESENNEKKKQKFEHKDITPYDALPDSSKAYDKAIVRNLADVINDL